MIYISSEVRRVPAADDLESLERVHFRIQRTGADSAVQGDSKAGGVLGSAVLTIVLACRAVTAGRPSLTREYCARVDAHRLISQKPVSGQHVVLATIHLLPTEGQGQGRGFLHLHPVSAGLRQIAKDPDSGSLALSGLLSSPDLWEI